MKLEKLEEKEEVVLPKTFIPKVITGGKGPPTGLTEGDWLSTLDIKTTVLIQKVQDSSFALGQATVVHKGTRGVLLALVGEQNLVWVDPVRFCNAFRKYEILQTAEEAELERLANASNRSNLGGQVEDAEETPTVD